ncbi:MAG: 4-demethylwyosine synthase TYW1 [Thaumarchaeota archaeon]|nr:4-demethylwyosine synthase TYW1 [Nitrososphaerota archaeon]
MSCSDETEPSSNIIQIQPSVINRLKKAKYGVSNHSTVELCHWTKKSFVNEGECYKKKFYGIDTHRCMEFSPAGMLCQNRCVYCWRPMEFYDSMKMPVEMVDEPESIMKNLMEERYRLMNGYFGNAKADKKKVKEAMMPSHYAISLSGEPTMYPKLPGLITYLKNLRDTKSIFLVTNGQEPEMLNRLQNEDALPTQLYLSTNAPNRRIFFMINKPRYRDAWERWWKSLLFLREMNTRTVVRITLIRSLNADLDLVPLFADMMKRGNPHFIEVKSYMHVGYSNQRLEESDMMEMSEVREYANSLANAAGCYKFMDESIVSRVVVLQNTERYLDRLIA